MVVACGLGDALDGAESFGDGGQSCGSGGLFGYAELEDVEGAGAKVEGLAGELAEVDEDVGAFGAAEDEAVDLDGRGEEALVAADLGQRLAVRE